MERGSLIWSTLESLLQIVGETIAPAVAFGVSAGKVSSYINLAVDFLR